MKVRALLLVTLGACAAPDEAAKIDAYIASLPQLPVEPAQVTEGARSSDAREGDYQCVTQSLAETRQYDRIVAYAANSDSLFPGALVSADSVLTGLFTPIVLPRAPATISISLENLDGLKSAVVDDPSLSSYRDALARILAAEITGATPANLSSEIEEVHSASQLDMALGVQASWQLGIASLESSFDFSSQQVRSRYVVRFMQTYYTVDVDTPAAPSTLFAPGVTLDDVAAKMDAQHPPAYVSSVAYGRMVVFTFESEFSTEEMGAALAFAFTGGVDVEGDVSVSFKDILSKSKITAFILGGDAGEAVKAIDGYGALIEFIKSGGNYSKESPGAPIAYKLSYLGDNSPARMSLTTDYDVEQCSRVSQKVRVTLQSITVDDAGGDGDNDLELFGSIRAEGTSTGSLFERTTANFVVIKAGSVFGTPIAETVIDVSPQPGQAIRLHADLQDFDTLSGSDLIGNDVVVNPFETGWRKDATMTLTGANARVRVSFSMSPI